jgi:hypothetical protein
MNISSSSSSSSSSSPSSPCTSFYYDDKKNKICVSCNTQYETCSGSVAREEDFKNIEITYEKTMIENWGRKFVNDTPFPLSIGGWTVKFGECLTQSHSIRIESGETKTFVSKGLCFWTNGWEQNSTKEESETMKKVTCGESVLVSFEGKTSTGWKQEARTWSSLKTFWGTIDIEDEKEVFTIHYKPAV